MRPISSSSGSSTVETAGLVAAIAVLLVSVLPGLGVIGESPLADRVSSTIARLTAGETIAVSGDASTARTVGSAGDIELQVGNDPPPAASDAARAWSRDWSWQRWAANHTLQAAWNDTRGSFTMCAICGEATVAVGVTPGAVTDGQLLHAQARGHAGLYAVRANATASTSVTAGPAQADWSGEAHAQAGLEASGRAEVDIGTDDVWLDAGATARAGASARAQHTTSISLAGLAINHVAGAEGWAGAGVTAGGTLGVRDGILTAAGRFGGALGFGGAADGRVEISFDRAAAQQTITELVSWAMPDASGSTARHSSNTSNRNG